MSDEIINQNINMLPYFILESQQFKSWSKHNPDKQIYHIQSNFLFPDLNITSQKNIDDIIDCESHFIFSQKHRIEILCRGIETGCPLKFELLEASIAKNNETIFNILINEIKNQGINLKSSTFCYAAKNASQKMFKKMLDEFVTTDINEFCFIRCRGELVSHAIHNTDNLKELLINRNLGSKQKTIGRDLIQECLNKSAPLSSVIAIEDHFGFNLEQYRESRSEYSDLEYYINEEVVKRDNLELFTYMLSCGYLVNNFLEDVAVLNGTTKITPGLIRSHLSLSM